MQSIEQLYALRDTVRHIGFCDLTANAVYSYMYGVKIDLAQVKILFEDWEDDSSNLSYSQYVINEINKELARSGFCLVQLANSSGNEKTLIHIFSLFWIQGEVYRLESYGKTIYNLISGQTIKKTRYCSRIVGWPTYQGDLQKLIEHTPGKERLAYWNGLFSSDEEIDLNESPLDVELTVKP